MRSPTGATVLRLIATSDLHAELRDFDYTRLRPDPARGLSRAAGLIERLRAEVPHSVLVDAGDFLHGRPYAALPDAGVHAVMAAMAAMRYDAVTLGNHDFDGGLDLLEAALARSEVPLVTGNIFRIASGEGFGLRYRLVRRQVTLGNDTLPLTIGLTGVLPPETLTGAENMPRDRLDVRPVPEIARSLVREMRDAGADLVLALCHEGPEFARVLAQAGVDAIAMGHLHGTFPGPNWPSLNGMDAKDGTILGIPAVMPGAFGRAVGTIDLTVERTAGKWRVVAREVAVHELAAQQPRLPSEPQVLAASRDVHADALIEAQRIVADLNVPVHTYFAKLGRCRATRLTAAAAARAVRGAVSRGPLEGRPVVGLMAPVMAGGLGGPRNFVDLPNGMISSRDLRDLAPYADPIWGIAATVADLALWLERSVSAFRQVIPGEYVPEVWNTAFPSAVFDLPDCATFELDLTQPAAFAPDGTRTGHPPARVLALRIGGQDMPPGTPILLAVSEHRVRGGGGFPLPEGAVPFPTGQRADHALRDYLQAGPPPLSSHVFSFRPVPHAIVGYSVGQGARAHSTDAAALGLLHVRPTQSGWDTYRMALDDTARTRPQPRFRLVGEGG